MVNKIHETPKENDKIPNGSLTENGAVVDKISWYLVHLYNWRPKKCNLFHEKTEEFMILRYIMKILHNKFK